jgi:hypothetical protein
MGRTDIAVKPLFIFSLPRSGSTLLQRLLSCNKFVDSVSETWLLLPVFYALKNKGVYAEYSHKGVYDALQDFIQTLPNGEDDYFSAIRGFSSYLYSNASSADALYFVEKTPRYALICDDVIKTFPSSKFIFLWRNPLSIIASMIETWGKGRWNIFRYKIDLYDGMEKMLEVYTNEEEAISIRYEDLVDDNVSVVSKVFLNLEGTTFDPDSIQNLSKVKLSGVMGDPTGSKKYSNVSNMSKNSWKKTINTPLRKWWVLRYLKWLGAERLRVMGYDYDELVLQVKRNSMSVKKIPSDIFMFVFGVLFCLMEPNILVDKVKNIGRWSKILRHK